MKRYVRSLLALLLILTLSASLLPSFPAKAYSAEAERAAVALYEMGLFRGTGTDSDGNPDFQLDRAPTRNEAAVMLVRLLGKEEAAKAGSWTTPFTDLADWAKPYVGFAYTEGLTNGTSSDTYGGDTLVSAAQYLTFMLRALGYDDARSDFRWDAPWELTDRIGMTAGNYGPDADFTRGDAAVLSLSALSCRLKDTDTTLARSLGLSDPASGVGTAAEPGLEVHFLDVGQADAALLRCGDSAMLIDGGNAQDSGFIYSYLREHGVEHLDYIVCTHPHEDHVGGLAGALNYAKADVALCPVTEYDSRVFESFVRYLDRQGLSITVPEAGDTFALGDAAVQVLGPVQREAENLNNLSIVLRVAYGDVSFLFTGDAQREEEADILSAGYLLKSTVLKVGHHGGANASSYPFLYAAEPEYGVISVGAGNLYGHPAESTLSRLRDAEVQVLRTDELGTIVFTTDGTDISYSIERDPVDAQSPQNTPDAAPSSGTGASPAAQTYVLNVSSGVFHLPDCGSVEKMAEKNKRYYEGSREEVLAMGYRPCGICNP